jgi:hypothetical protein
VSKKLAHERQDSRRNRHHPPSRLRTLGCGIGHVAERDIGGRTGSRSNGARSRRRPFAGLGDTFRCRHCRLLVGPVLFGGAHRNHCPACLFSRHVDDRTPGDRASVCGQSMAPVGVFTRPKGEHVIVHQCAGCGLQRYCRIAADDDFALLMRLPLLVPEGVVRRRERLFKSSA